MTMIGDHTIIVVIFGVFIGIIARTVLYYMEKVMAAEAVGEKITFKWTYLITSLIAFSAAIAPTITFFPVAVSYIETLGISGAFALPAVFFISAITAYGSNEAINFGVKITQRSVEKFQLARLNKTKNPEA